MICTWLLWNGFRTGVGSGRSVEKEWKWIGRASEWTGSRKDLASTRALRPRAHSVLFRKADQTEKTGEPIVMSRGFSQGYEG